MFKLNSMQMKKNHSLIASLCLLIYPMDILLESRLDTWTNDRFSSSHYSFFCQYNQIPVTAQWRQRTDISFLVYLSLKDEVQKFIFHFILNLSASKEAEIQCLL